MKTVSRLLLVSFVVILSANSHAQNSVNDLFNTYVIAPAQQRIQILSDELSDVNAQIQDLQDQLAASAAQASPDAGAPDPDVSPVVSPFAAQITELQARTVELQNTLSFWQAQLALWMSYNSQQQEQYLLANYSQTVTSTGEDIATILAGPDNRFGPMPDPNNPWIVPVFVSTGDAQQDAQLVQQWLFQHGLIDSIGQ